MSHDEPKAYSQLYINLWTAVSAVITFVLWAVYVCGTQLLHFFNWVWDLLRYICYSLGII